MTSICIISRALPVHRLGGLEFHARDLAHGLAKRGITVHLVTTAGGAAENFETGPDSGTVAVHEVAGSVEGDYSISFFRGLPIVLRRIVSSFAPQVIIAIDMAGFFLEPSFRGVRVYPLIHGTMTSEVPLDRRYWPYVGITDKLRFLWRHKARFVLMPVFKRMISRAPGVITDSDFTRQELERIADGASARIVVCELGIDVKRYPEPTIERVAAYCRGDALRVCMLGRLQKIKGIEQALRAIEMLAARGVNVRLSVAGTGDYAAEAKRWVASRDLGACITFVGRVEPEDFGNFLVGHHLFLFPDLTQPAFGLVSVEAMRYGLPVVAARVGAVPEVVADGCGWLYDAWDYAQMADMLEMISNNPDELALKAKATLTCWKTFTAEMMVERFLVALSQLNASS